MPYNFYCTGCGRELNESKVLFDMGPLLVGSIEVEEQLKLIKFRMTAEDLRNIWGQGKKTEMGYRLCRLHLTTLMSYVANENNLNKPDIASLTLDDASEYIKNNDWELSSPASDEEDIYAESDSGEGIATQEKKKSKAIEALESCNIKIADDQNIIGLVVSDLRVIKNLFSEKDYFEFELKLVSEKDNDGNPVLIGYTLKSGSPRHETTVNRARICAKCGYTVFDHAGTAEHRAVVFVGGQKSGKTSTILALSHYAKYGIIKGGSKDGIWESAGPLSDVTISEVLSSEEKFEVELDMYKKGQAPSKTDSAHRNCAYPVTIRFKNKLQNKHYFLTLTDISGEICEEKDGSLEESKIRDEFQVALSCQAYVLCFDTLKAQKENLQDITQKVCNWTNRFQQLRYEREEDLQRMPGYVPVMVLYTKCGELENPEPQDQKVLGGKRNDVVSQLYSLSTEKRFATSNPMYQYVGTQLKAYDCLNQCYQSQLRVSAFGYHALNPQDPDFDEAKLQTPTPKQIHLLMKWLLELCGCIPVDAKCSTEAEAYSAENNFVERVQYRTQRPLANKVNSRYRESLIRCHLFENPGYFDREYVNRYGDGLNTWLLRLRERFTKKSNND